MDIFALVMLALSGGLIGAMIGMALATPFEYDKKYAKAALTYLACIIFMSLIFVVPVIIIYM
jgi:hypothetical protein